MSSDTTNTHETSYTLNEPVGTLHALEKRFHAISANEFANPEVEPSQKSKETLLHLTAELQNMGVVSIVGDKFYDWGKMFINRDNSINHEMLKSTLERFESLISSDERKINFNTKNGSYFTWGENFSKDDFLDQFKKILGEDNIGIVTQDKNSLGVFLHAMRKMSVHHKSLGSNDEVFKNEFQSARKMIGLLNSIGVNGVGDMYDKAFELCAEFDIEDKMNEDLLAVIKKLSYLPVSPKYNVKMVEKYLKVLLPGSASFSITKLASFLRPVTRVARFGEEWLNQVLQIDPNKINFLQTLDFNAFNLLREEGSNLTLNQVAAQNIITSELEILRDEILGINKLSPIPDGTSIGDQIRDDYLGKRNGKKVTRTDYLNSKIVPIEITDELGVTRYINLPSALVFSDESSSGLISDAIKNFFTNPNYSSQSKPVTEPVFAVRLLNDQNGNPDLTLLSKLRASEINSKSIVIVNDLSTDNISVFLTKDHALIDGAVAGSKKNIIESLLRRSVNRNNHKNFIQSPHLLEYSKWVEKFEHRQSGNYHHLTVGFDFDPIEKLSDLLAKIDKRLDLEGNVKSYLNSTGITSNAYALSILALALFGDSDGDNLNTLFMTSKHHEDAGRLTQLILSLKPVVERSQNLWQKLKHSEELFDEKEKNVDLSEVEKLLLEIIAMPTKLSVQSKQPHFESVFMFLSGAYGRLPDSIANLFRELSQSTLSKIFPSFGQAVTADVNLSYIIQPALLGINSTAMAQKTAVAIAYDPSKLKKYGIMEFVVEFDRENFHRIYGKNANFEEFKSRILNNIQTSCSNVSKILS